jgi:hypothetical protein
VKEGTVPPSNKVDGRHLQFGEQPAECGMQALDLLSGASDEKHGRHESGCRGGHKPGLSGGGGGGGVRELAGAEGSVRGWVKGVSV